jgi:hypothetical protein
LRNFVERKFDAYEAKLLAMIIPCAGPEAVEGEKEEVDAEGVMRLLLES